MKSISHMNFVQSAYPMVERASTELQSLAQKITSCMPAYFSNYSKVRALVIFTISLAAIYALYAYARSHKSDKACELPLEKLKESTPTQVVRVASSALLLADQDGSDTSEEFEPILPPDLYYEKTSDRNSASGVRSITPPPQEKFAPIPDSEEEFAQGIKASSTPARPHKSREVPITSIKVPVPYHRAGSISPPQSPL